MVGGQAPPTEVYVSGPGLRKQAAVWRTKKNPLNQATHKGRVTTARPCIHSTVHVKRWKDCETANPRLSVINELRTADSLIENLLRVLYTVFTSLCTNIGKIMHVCFISESLSLY